MLSTAEALAVCAFAQYTWHLSLGADARLIRLCRYVDDVVGVVAFKRGDQASLARAQKLAENFRLQCYPYGLLLETEEIKEGMTVFLETKTLIVGTKIVAFHNNKNIASIAAGTGLKFYNMQNSMSFSSRASKRGAIIAKLVSISHACQTRFRILFCVIQLYRELKLFGYGYRIFHQACRRMYMRTGDDICTIVLDFVRAVFR